MTNKTQEITQQYEGVKIRYLEASNSWEFELRGRTRTAPSLVKAREWIDKEPKAKRKPFDRFEAYKYDHWGEWKEVTVLSYAGTSAYGGKHQFWVGSSKAGKGGRTREDAEDLIFICPDTEDKRAKLKVLKQREKALEKEIGDCLASFQRVAPTADMLKED